MTKSLVNAQKARIATIRRAKLRDWEFRWLHPCARPLGREIDFPSWEVMDLAMRMAKALVVHDDYLVFHLDTILCIDKRHSVWKLYFVSFPIVWRN